MTERRVVEERSTRTGRSGGVDPAVGIFIAVLLAAVVGLLIWYFGYHDNNGSSNNPNPNPGTSQQQDQPKDSSAPEPSSGSTP